MLYRDFITKKPEFLVDNVPLFELLEKGQTPVYATALSSVQARVFHYQKALAKHFKSSQVHYAVKANFGMPLLKSIQEMGAGADIVSLGEWKQVMKAGFKPNQVCFAGVGKTQAELTLCLKEGVGMINVEHWAEFEFLISQNLGATGLSLRLNPAVEVETHPHLKTGAIDSKFGLLFDEIRMGFQKKYSKDQLKSLVGIHVHVGSQLMDPSLFPLVMKELCQCAEFLIAQGAPITHFDLGGGLGVGFEGTPMDHQDIYDHITVLSHALKQQMGLFPTLPKWEDCHIMLEPGRSLVASSTILLTKVLYTKERVGISPFVYVDAGMNDFLRPMLYQAQHPCVMIQSINPVPQETLRPTTVVGPVCESADTLAKDVLLPPLFPGDILGFLDAGAYCRSMASQYNLRPLTREVYAKEGKIIG